MSRWRFSTEPAACRMRGPRAPSSSASYRSRKRSPTGMPLASGVSVRRPWKRTTASCGEVTATIGGRAVFVWDSSTMMNGVWCAFRRPNIILDAHATVVRQLRVPLLDPLGRGRNAMWRAAEGGVSPLADARADLLWSPYGYRTGAQCLDDRRTNLLPARSRHAHEPHCCNSCNVGVRYGVELDVAAAMVAPVLARRPVGDGSFPTRSPRDRLVQPGQGGA